MAWSAKDEEFKADIKELREAIRSLIAAHSLDCVLWALKKETSKKPNNYYKVALLAAQITHKAQDCYPKED